MVESIVQTRGVGRKITRDRKPKGRGKRVKKGRDVLLALKQAHRVEKIERRSRNSPIRTRQQESALLSDSRRVRGFDREMNLSLPFDNLGKIAR